MAVNVLICFIVLTKTIAFPEALSERGWYQKAREVRAVSGHDAAVPLYKTLLQNRTIDFTAASRMAAANSSPARHDAALPDSTTNEDASALRELLLKSNFTNRGIRGLFGVEGTPLAFASGPVYLRAAGAGSARSGSLQADALQCLASMFLLGFAVPRAVLCKALSQPAIALLHRLGLVFPCELDDSLLLPYVQIFPLELSAGQELFFVTDWHPGVLSLTNLGVNQQGAVMYIGPDSLALIQHFHQSILPHHINQCTHPPSSFNILDLCCGSGVQAISALALILNQGYNATALCVDINDRALRFTKFNAMLNSIQDSLFTKKHNLITSNHSSLLLDRYHHSFHMILANPPFIPVPTDHRNTSQRYGLFSSGGSDGQEVLRVIIALSSHLLTKSNGILALVSEFMNPCDDRVLCQNIQHWWHDFTTPPNSTTSSARGILFTNEYPVNASTYALRRADNEEEYPLWKDHLKRMNISSISPGLLFVCTEDVGESSSGLVLQHKCVKKCALGSIWTPQNRHAVDSTYSQWLSSYKNN